MSNSEEPPANNSKTLTKITTQYTSEITSVGRTNDDVPMLQG